MDRLTTSGETWHDCDFMDSGIAPYLNRLAAYEDLGTPEQLAARVEVVRCKECRHRLAGNWCSVVGSARGDEEFCSFGERRER